MLDHGASASAVTLELTGEPETLFRWISDRCDTNDTPDAPGRSFRDAEGRIQFLATHFDNRLFSVVDGKLKHKDCRIILDSPGDPNPANYRDRRWISATWTDDGKVVHALIHHEYQGHRHAGACSLASYVACWYNTITYARSDDGGMTFAQSDPPGVVAAAPFEQDVGQGRHRGFFSPTNIIKVGEYWYVLIYTTGWDGQAAGMCLFRSSNIAQPELWLAWDGKAFGSHFGDPYRGAATSAAHCKPVINQWVGSIQRILGTDAIVAVFFHQSRLGQPQSWQLAYSVSHDLLHWGAPVDLKALPYSGSRDCGDTARFGYPSLMDMTGVSSNFDEVGETADLFLTLFHVQNCGGSLDRDIIRYKVQIRRSE